MDKLRKSVDLPSELTVEEMLRGLLALDPREQEETFHSIKKGLERRIKSGEIHNQTAKALKLMWSKIKNKEERKMNFKNLDFSGTGIYEKKNRNFFRNLIEAGKVTYLRNDVSEEWAMEHPEEYDRDIYYDLLQVTDSDDFWGINQIPVPVFLKIVGWNEKMGRSDIVKKIASAGILVEKVEERWKRTGDGWWIPNDCSDCEHFRGELIRYLNYEKKEVYEVIHRCKCVGTCGSCSSPTYHIEEKGIPLGYFEGGTCINGLVPWGFIPYRVTARQGDLVLLGSGYIVDIKKQEVVHEVKDFSLEPEKEVTPEPLEIVTVHFGEGHPLFMMHNDKEGETFSFSPDERFKMAKEVYVIRAKGGKKYLHFVEAPGVFQQLVEWYGQPHEVFFLTPGNAVWLLEQGCWEGIKEDQKKDLLKILGRRKFQGREELIHKAISDKNLALWLLDDFLTVDELKKAIEGGFTEGLNCAKDMLIARFAKGKPKPEDLLQEYIEVKNWAEGVATAH